MLVTLDKNTTWSAAAIPLVEEFEGALASGQTLNCHHIDMVQYEFTRVVGVAHLRSHSPPFASPETRQHGTLLTGRIFQLHYSTPQHAGARTNAKQQNSHDCPVPNSLA